MYFRQKRKGDNIIGGSTKKKILSNDSDSISILITSFHIKCHFGVFFFFLKLSIILIFQDKKKQLIFINYTPFFTYFNLKIIFLKII